MTSTGRGLGLTALLAALVLTAGCGASYSPTRVPSAAEKGTLQVREEVQCTNPLQSFSPDTDPGHWRKVLDEKMVVGVNADAPPLASRNLDSGALEGFEIDLATAVTDILYGEPGHLQLVTVDDQPVPRTDRSHLDLVIGQVPMTCSNWDRATFSASYLTTSTAMLVRSGDPKKPVSPTLQSLPYPTDRICTNRGNQQVLFAEAQAPGSVSQCLVRLQQGRADLIVTETAQAGGLIAQDPAVQRVPGTADTTNYAVLADSSEPELQAMVNAALSQWIASGGWQASHDRWLRPLVGEGRPPQPSYGRNQ